MTPFQLRRDVLETALKMSRTGLSRGTSGNVSARVSGGFLITPSGMPYEDMRADDIVAVKDDGRVGFHSRNPSSEWRIHRDVYLARGDVGAVVHTHSVFCSTLAILRRPIPAVHYMIAVTGTAVVPCADYATFGTQELSDAALAVLGQGKACLLANHGMLALGKDLTEAFRIASEVELLAEQYWRACQAGAPHVLPDEEIARVVARFQTYGVPGRKLRSSNG